MDSRWEHWSCDKIDASKIKKEQGCLWNTANIKWILLVGSKVFRRIIFRQIDTLLEQILIEVLVMLTLKKVDVWIFGCLSSDRVRENNIIKYFFKALKATKNLSLLLKVKKSFKVNRTGQIFSPRKRQGAKLLQVASIETKYFFLSRTDALVSAVRIVWEKNIYYIPWKLSLSRPHQE